MKSEKYRFHFSIDGLNAYTDEDTNLYFSFFTFHF